MAMYLASGRYYDFDNREGAFTVESNSADRNRISRIVKERYDAKKVIINCVNHIPQRDPRADDARIARENAEFRAAEARLSSSGSSFSGSSSSSSFSAPRRQQTSSGGSAGGGLGLLVLLGLGAVGLGAIGGGGNAPAPAPERPSIERSYEAPTRSYEPIAPVYEPASPVYEAPAPDYGRSVVGGFLEEQDDSWGEE